MDAAAAGVTADGSRGQFACADRRTGAVVVKTSQWPYDDFLVDRQARDLSYLGLHALLDAQHCTPDEGVRTVNRNVMITCALTGAGDTVGRSEHVPVTPEQIAESGIAAARAGATIVHVHVRDPETGKGSREVALYREVVERIRASDVDVIINTTAGMGGDLMLDPHDPTTFVEGTDLVSGVDRLPARRGAAARHLHARLRQPQLRRGQPGLRQHAGHAARGRQEDPGARRPVRDGDLRHRPPVVRQRRWSRRG